MGVHQKHAYSHESLVPIGGGSGTGHNEANIRAKENKNRTKNPEKDKGMPLSGQRRPRGKTWGFEGRKGQTRGTLPNREGRDASDGVTTGYTSTTAGQPKVHEQIDLKLSQREACGCAFEAKYHMRHSMEH